MQEIYRSPAFLLEGYRAFTVKYSDGTKRTVLEHREIMEKHLGRRLASSEIVHHKDENKLNNVADNFELKTPSTHARHHALQNPAPMDNLTCAECGKEFQRESRFVRRNKKLRGQTLFFCTKSCGAKHNIRIRWQKLNAGVVKPEQQRVLS